MKLQWFDHLWLCIRRRDGEGGGERRGKGDLEVAVGLLGEG
jgi:hypothetical protein